MTNEPNNFEDLDNMTMTSFEDLDNMTMTSSEDSSEVETKNRASKKADKKGSKKKMSKKKKVLLGILISLLSLIVILVSAFFILRYMGKLDFLKNHDSANIRVIDGASSPDNGHTVYYKGQKYIYNENMASIIFLGIDRSELGTDEVGNAGQADAVYIFSYDTKTGKSYIIPVSRETMTDVRLYSMSGQEIGIEKKQLCLAYGYGDGKETSCENTLYSLSNIFYNLPFETYLALNWDGIGPLNDLSGGVTLTALEDVPLESRKLYKGETVTLKGLDAKAYVRFRNITKLTSNNDRLDRQRQYLNAYMAKMIPMVKSRFSLISDIYDTASNYMYTNFTYGQVLYSASTILPETYSNNDIEFVTIKGKVKQGETYAEFYPNQTSLYESILKVFYLKATN